MVRDLFRDKEANEFIIATIPSVLAVKESERLLKALRKENIPCKRIIVNQVSLALLWDQININTKVQTLFSERSRSEKSMPPAMLSLGSFDIQRAHSLRLAAKFDKVLLLVRLKAVRMSMLSVNYCSFVCTDHRARHGRCIPQEQVQRPEQSAANDQGRHRPPRSASAEFSDGGLGSQGSACLAVFWWCCLGFSNRRVHSR